MGEVYHGGCLCGRTRFEADAPGRNVHLCDCSMCRRHSGALALAWIEFDRDAVRWTGPGGPPALYRSSTQSSRAFCPVCGSTLGAVDDAPVIALTLGSLDEPHDELLARLTATHGDS